MLFCDPTYSMGNIGFFKKAGIVLGILTNPLKLIPDKLGLVRYPRYKSRTGLDIVTRSRTTDINEAVMVLSGSEYPEALVNVSGEAEPVVVDCGGHIGTFSLFVHKLNPTIRLYIMEPSKENLVLLRKNLDKNGVKAVVIDKALYGTKGHYYLDTDGKPFDAGELVTAPPQGHKYFEIDALTMRDVVESNRIDRIDLLKMDIEGSEYDVVEKDYAFLAEKVKRLVMEYHVSANPDGRKVVMEFLVKRGGFQLIYESKNVLGFHNPALS